jgi:hypothetical protein
MGPLRPTTRWLLASLFALLVALALVSHYRGCREMPFTSNLLAHVLQGTGILTFCSQGCQDRWVVFEVFPGVRKGYFVDLGSADGVLHSNSKTLEELGWEGICIDPFPKNMASRRCTVFTHPVDSSGGKRVRFRNAGGIGGIEEHLGVLKGLAQQFPAVELETRTLTDILAQANAPSYIHYMSIDIEGAELEALKGLDFSRYRFGALTIEHNFEEPKRTRIRALLESKGYKLVRSVDQDDFYLGAGA